MFGNVVYTNLCVLRPVNRNIKIRNTCSLYSTFIYIHVSILVGQKWYRADNIYFVESDTVKYHEFIAAYCYECVARVTMLEAMNE